VEEKARIQRQQLQQADKMISLGLLVSGVAHEINNPNNFIILNIPILKKVWISVLPVLDEYYETHKEFQIARFPYEQMRDEYFEICSNILDGATRIKTIVKDLKEYSGKEVEGETELIDINKVILSCINLLGNNIKKYTNHLSLELAENLPLIAGKYQHFEQILINLIQNACQALKNRDDSVVIKSIHNNNVVEIYVIDSGIGIAKENLNRIFDPFYTTKRDEGGTGLGLSVSNNLVKKYNGNLTFVSNTAKGTSAIVSFPVKL
jgi:signal transduction histidine kinase